MPELVVALDVDKTRAIELVELLKPKVNYFKVGYRLFFESTEVINLLNRYKKNVFLDLKLHDIPSVVSAAIKIISEKYVPYAITVHISGGKKMLQEAVKSKCSLLPVIQPKIFGVTVLTSLDMSDMQLLGMKSDIVNQVKRMAKIANDTSLDGIVCSGREVEVVKKTTDKLLTLVPGIKILSEGRNYDQKRTEKIDRIRKYIDYIVVGREIYQSDNPLDIVKQIIRKLSTIE